MGRRYGLPLNGKRYCGDTNKMEVHDLDYEDRSPAGCRIDEIIAAGHARVFFLDSLFAAHQEGFSDCARCMGYAEARSVSVDNTSGQEK